MTVTSSYSNNHDAATDDPHQVVLQLEEDLFLRTPVAAALDVQRDKIAECDRQRGHILYVTRQVNSGKPAIKCNECAAEWVCEGFWGRDHPPQPPAGLLNYSPWRDSALISAIDRAQGNLRHVAKLLGVGRATVDRWIRQANPESS